MEKINSSSFFTKYMALVAKSQLILHQFYLIQVNEQCDEAWSRTFSTFRVEFII